MVGQKTRLLFVNTDMCAGGIEVSLINLLNEIDYSKYQIDLLLLTDNLDFLSRIPESVNIIRCSRSDADYSWQKLWTYVQRLYSVKRTLLQKVLLRVVRYFEMIMFCRYAFKKIKKSHYDVSVAYRPGIAAEIALRYAKSDKKILFFHASAVGRYWHDFLHYRLADNIVCVSKGDVKRDLLALFPCIAEKLVFMGNMVKINHNVPAMNTLADIDENRITIVSVGRLVHDKGFDLLIRSCAELRRKGYNIYLTIVGGDAGIHYDKYLHDLISELKLQDFVNITGFKENPYKYVVAADIYVQSSRIEAFGLTIREAQMLGKPVISTRTDGACELIEDNKTGIICDCTAEAIADAIKKLITNPDLRKYLIHSCKNMDFKEYNQKQLDVFYSIIDKTGDNLR